MDNDFAFFGPSSKERFLSKVVLSLLLHNIIPIFTAPRKPWNQASIEGIIVSSPESSGIDVILNQFPR